MQRTGQTLPCQAPSRPSYIPGHSSLNRRCNTSLSNVGPVAWRWNLRVNWRVQPEKARTSELCLSRPLQAQPKSAKIANV